MGVQGPRRRRWSEQSSEQIMILRNLRLDALHLIFSLLSIGRSQKHRISSSVSEQVRACYGGSEPLAQFRSTQARACLPVVQSINSNSQLVDTGNQTSVNRTLRRSWLCPAQSANVHQLLKASTCWGSPCAATKKIAPVAVAQNWHQIEHLF